MNSNLATGPTDGNGLADDIRPASRIISSARKKLTFREAYEQVQDNEQGKWDVLVRRQDIISKDGKLAFPLDPLGEYWEALAPTPWATAQICAHLGIPTTYFRRCPAVLQDIQLNYWLRPPYAQAEDGDREESADDGFEFISADTLGACSAPQANDAADQSDDSISSDGESDLTSKTAQAERQTWLLRARHGNLRAVLSGRYSPLDNPVMLKCLEAAWREHFRVDWFALDDETLHLRIVDPTLVQEGLPDDDLMAGVHISNSEVGKRAVTVDAMVFRLVCSNGLIRQVRGKSLLRQRHIHVSQERFHEQLAGAICEGLTVAAGFMTQFASTARQPITDVGESMKRLGERWHLSQDVQETALQAMKKEKSGQQETVYGLVNGLTCAAQELSMDHRYDLEVLAGRLAEYGLPSWAQASNPTPRMPVPGFAVTARLEENSPPDAIELAKEMFEAEIVQR